MEHRPEIESFAFGKAKHPCSAGNSPKRPGNLPKTPARCFPLCRRHRVACRSSTGALTRMTVGQRCHFTCLLHLPKRSLTCVERYTSEHVEQAQTVYNVRREVYNGKKCEKHNTKVRDVRSMTPSKRHVSCMYVK